MNVQKLRPIVFLLIACCAVYGLAAEEPNECAWMNGAFNVVDSNTGVEWGPVDDEGPVPKFCVSVILGCEKDDDDFVVKEMRQTEAWNSLSESQIEFSKHHSFCQWQGLCRGLYQGYQIRYLYGVSRADAAKLAQIFLKVKATQAVKKRVYRKQTLQEAEKELAHAEKQLPLKQAELTAMQQQYEKIRMNARYISLSDDEAIEAAKQSILRMNTMLDEIEIEKVGVEARIHAIQQQLKKYAEYSLAWGQFEGQLIEQTIDLTALEARNQSALKVRDQQNDFLSSWQKLLDLKHDVSQYQDTIERSPVWIDDWRKVLTGSHRIYCPPLAGNQVVIHPVFLKLRVKKD